MELWLSFRTQNLQRCVAIADTNAKRTESSGTLAIVPNTSDGTLAIVPITNFVRHWLLPIQMPRGL